MGGYLDELNAEQRAAATHGEGPVLVVAGAGTGKTKTLACRVAYLIERGTAPERILLLTFTRRAAAEMVSRAARVIDPKAGAAHKVWGGTFHATANRLLRIHGRSIGLSPEFTVMDQSDAADLINLIRSDLGLAKTNRRFPRKSTLAAIYSRMVNARAKLSELVERHYPWCLEDLAGIRQVIEGYTARKRAQNVLDYDDLLLYWHALTRSSLGGEIEAAFSHILVDEYQDTNLIQAEILQQMRRTNRNLMVVGDDAQSIYSFRAATVRNILDFPTQFPGAAVIKLEQNYRSVQPILDASNAVMEQAGERYTKNLFSQRPANHKPALVTCFDEAEQTSEVCTRILEHLEQGIPLRQQAVLFRAGHHSDALEVELTRRNIPFVKYGGLKFVEAAHIKDLLAMLRILENPADEISWFRVLLLLQGIGPASAARMLQSMGVRAEAGEAEGASGAAVASAKPPGSLATMLGRAAGIPTAGRDEFAALRLALLDCLGVPRGAAGIVTKVGERTSGVAGAREHAQRPLGALGAKDHPDAPLSMAPSQATVPHREVVSSPLVSGAGLNPASTIERLRRFYEPIFKRIYDNPAVRLRDLDQLEQIATQYKSRSAFLTDLSLDPPTSTQDLAGPPLLEEDWVTLSTIHSAKGMEYEVVHILHVADGMIPSDMATGSQEEIDEERRLLYVAMTRAKTFLRLYFPLRYYHRQRGLTDRHSYAQLTRFIPESGAGLFERVSAQRVLEHEAARDAAGPAGADAAASSTIDSMLKELMGG